MFEPYQSDSFWKIRFKTIDFCSKVFVLSKDTYVWAVVVSVFIQVWDLQFQDEQPSVRQQFWKWYLYIKIGKWFWVFSLIRNKMSGSVVLFKVTCDPQAQAPADCLCLWWSCPDYCTGTGRIVLLWWFIIGVCTVLRSFADLGMQVWRSWPYLKNRNMQFNKEKLTRNSCGRSIIKWE